MDQKLQFSSFFLEDTLFGIPVESVKEIVSTAEMTPVPLAPKVVRGLINLRGQIVTAIDLRTCLGLSDRSDRQTCVHVIVHVADGYASLLVDRVGEIVEVDQNAFDPLPETLRGAARQLIREAFKINSGLLLVLDLDRVVDTLSGVTNGHPHGSAHATGRKTVGP